MPIVLKTDFKILKTMKNLQNITPWLKLSKSPLKKVYNYVLFWISNSLFALKKNDFFVTRRLGPVKPGARAAKPIPPPPPLPYV